MKYIFIIFAVNISVKMSYSVSRSATNVSKASKESKKLFIRVGGAYYVDEKLPSPETLERIFLPFGEITSLIVTRDKDNAFISFKNAEDALKAKNAVNGFEVQTHAMGKEYTRHLFVDFAREKTYEQRERHRAENDRIDRLTKIFSEDGSPGASVSAPVRAPAPELPDFDPSILDDCNDSIFEGQSHMKWLGPQACMTLLDIGRNPQPRVLYKNMTFLQLFSDGSPLVWYIPHPNHPSALTECLEGLDSGRFCHMTSVRIPSEVLKMPKCWRS